MAVSRINSAESIRTGTEDPYSFNFTPSSTARGIVVAVMHGVQSTALVSSVTYGGVAMQEIVSAADTATEPGYASLWFLGSGVPSGTQSVSADLTSASGTDVHFVVWALGGDDDLEVIDFDSLAQNQANPTVTLTAGGRTKLSIAALYSGLASPQGTLATGNTLDHTHDFGSFMSQTCYETTVDDQDHTIGWSTLGSDDLAFVAMAVSEVQPNPYGYVELFGQPDSIRTADGNHLDITGDYEAIMCVALADWTPSGIAALYSKWQGGTTATDIAYAFRIHSAGGIVNPVYFDTNASSFEELFGSATGRTDGEHLWIRVLFDVSTNCVVQTSTDPIDTSPGSVSWSTLNTLSFASSPVAISSNSQPLWLGLSRTTNDGMVGKYYYFELKDGLGGTTVAKMDARTSDPTGSDGFGNSWSLNSVSWTAPTAGPVSGTGAASLDAVTAEADGIVPVPPEDGYLLLDGTGDYANVQSSRAAFGFNGDHEFRIDVAMDDWDDLTAMFWESAPDFYLDGGEFIYDWTDSGSTHRQASSGFSPGDLGFVDGQRVQLRVAHDIDNGSSQNVVTFYYRTGEDIADLTDNSNWTQFAQITQGFATSYLSTTPSQVRLGSYSGGGYDVAGRIYQFLAYNGLGGTVYANPDFRSDAVTDWGSGGGNDAAGNNWVLNGDATWVAPSGHSGSAAATLEAFTASASGTRTIPTRSGTGAATLDALTGAAAGSHTPPLFSGEGAGVLAAFTADGDGATVPPTWSGTGAAVLAAFTGAAAGAHTPPVFSGEGAASLAAFTGAAEGTRTIPTRTGAAAADLDEITAAGVGGLTGFVVEGEAAITLEDFAPDGLGGGLIHGGSGAGASTLADFFPLAEGQAVPPLYSGEADVSLAGFVGAAEGVFNLLPSGTVDVTLDQFEALGSGQIINEYTGTGAATLEGVVAAGRGAPLSPVPTLLDYRIWYRFRP